MVRLLVVAVALLFAAVTWQGVQLRDARGRLDALERAPPRPADERVRRDATSAAVEARRTIDTAQVVAADAPIRPAAARVSATAEVVPVEEVVAARVPDLVRGELAKIDEERDQKREERQRERLTKRLDELAATASISAEKKAQVLQMLTAEQTEMQQLFRDAREGHGGWGEMREKAEALRKQTDENVDAVFDDDEMAAFRKMREEERGRFGGGGRRGE